MKIHRPFAETPHRLPTRLAGAIAAALLAAVLFALAACGGASTAATPTPTASPAATATPTMLYQADWSKGLAGWNATAGWSVVNGALQSDTGDKRSVTIPYQPSTQDYTVEFDLQVLDIPRDGGYYMLTATPSASLSGYSAGVYSLRQPGVPRPNGDHPTISTLIVPQDAQDAASVANSVKDFEPGDSVRTYRIMVQANAALFYVDGRFFTSAESTQSKHLAPGPLNIICGGVSIRVTGLRIYSA